MMADLGFMGMMVDPKYGGVRSRQYFSYVLQWRSTKVRLRQRDYL
jgi:hypothetical protein